MKVINLLKKYITIENIAITVICFLGLFSSSRLMTDVNILPKRLFTFLALSVCIILLSIKVVIGRKIHLQPVCVSMVITILCAMEAILALFQFGVFKMFNIPNPPTGSFDNPAGLMSSLCLSLPFALYLIYRGVHRKLCIVTVLIIVCAIFISESRTGVLACLLCLSIWFPSYNKFPKTKIIFISIIVCAALTVIFYNINHDSADGRMLIWRACMPLLVSTPVCGYGVGAFERLYMHAQADYLLAFDPNSKYAMLAGQSMVPFNEYINFYLSFGLIGLLLFVGFIVLLIIAYRRNRSKIKFYALMSLGMLSFISCFSYPLVYSYSYIILIISVVFIFKGSFQFFYKKQLRISVAIFCILVGGYAVNVLVGRINSELDWGEAYRKGDIVAYGKLKQRLGNVPYFLYNYAFELCRIGDHDLSLSIAQECSKIFSHYDLELLMGDLYLKKGDFINAEKHYKIAAHMCPCKFVPLQSLHEVYLASGNDEKAMSIARIIVDKPMKVPTQSVKLIRYKMKKYLNDTGD